MITAGVGRGLIGSTNKHLPLLWGMATGEYVKLGGIFVCQLLEAVTWIDKTGESVKCDWLCHRDVRTTMKSVRMVANWNILLTFKNATTKLAYFGFLVTSGV